MDKKLLQLLQSDESANYLLVSQMYGEDKLLKYILNSITEEIPISDEGHDPLIDKNVMFINIAWFSFYKFDKTIWISFNRNAPCVCFDSYHVKEMEVILSLVTKKYKEFIK